MRKAAAQFGDPPADIAEADDADGLAERLRCPMKTLRFMSCRRACARSVSTTRLARQSIMPSTCSATASALPPDWLTTRTPALGAGLDVDRVVAGAVGRHDQQVGRARQQFGVGV